MYNNKYGRYYVDVVDIQDKQCSTMRQTSSWTDVCMCVPGWTFLQLCVWVNSPACVGGFTFMFRFMCCMRGDTCISMCGVYLCFGVDKHADMDGARTCGFSRNTQFSSCQWRNTATYPTWLCKTLFKTHGIKEFERNIHT